MNDRQRNILSAIIELYTENAIPVGSQAILENYDLDVSSATIRNDMALLESEGYLHQPHTSAGRIPTDRAYRMYVEELMGDEGLSRKEQERLQHELLLLKAKQARMGRSTAKLLATLSGNLGLYGIIDREEFYDFGMRELIEDPEFQNMDELCRLVEVLDSIDERIDIMKESFKDGQARIYIGEENPIIGISPYSMIIAPYQTDEGQGILAIIGPKRMHYAKNKSLIEYMQKILSDNTKLLSSLAALALIPIIK